VRAPALSAVTLLRRKLAVVAVFTRETAEGSNIEAVMRPLRHAAACGKW
jgi:hypothetical protein